MEEVCGFHKSQIMPHDSLICVLCPGSVLTSLRTSCRKYFGYQHIFHTDNGKEFIDIPLKTNKLIYWIKILLRYSYWISDALFFVLIHFLLLETF